MKHGWLAALGLAACLLASRGAIYGQDETTEDADTTAADAADAAEDAANEAADAAEDAAGDAGTTDGVSGGAAVDLPDPAPEPQIYDEVRLTNGSVIIGKIVALADGSLTIETAFGVDEVVKVKWSEVESVRTNESHQFLLENGELIIGKIVRTEDGAVVIQGDKISGETKFALTSVDAINPPEKKDVTLEGNINFGGSIADGNTQTKTANFNAEAVARSDRQRLTLNGQWNYAEDSGGITARNTRGSVKYDFFVDDARRFYLFASAFFEEDSFQDLNLRTALSGGPGYQFVKKGDFDEDSFFHKLEIYGEAGLAFFNEDFRTSPDNRYVSARWAARVDLPIRDKLALFHRHEVYPGLERADDIYVITQQGVRFSIWEGFIATAQVNFRWDNTPSAGFERTDTLYLLTLGYQFEL